MNSCNAQGLPSGRRTSVTTSGIYFQFRLLGLLNSYKKLGRCCSYTFNPKVELTIEICEEGV